MEAMNKEAQEYYTKCSNEVKATAVKLFNRMDTDGDSSINVAEMSSFLKGNKILSKMLTAEELVYGIDGNGNGKLDFKEFITLFYILFAMSECDGCGAKLMGQRRLTCISCFANGADDSFDLCSSCFSSKTFVHIHRIEDGSFVDFTALMLHMASDNNNNNNQVEEATQRGTGSTYKKQSVSSKLYSPEGLKKVERVHKVTKASLEIVQHMTTSGCNIM